MTMPQLSGLDLALAAGLLIVNAGLSIALKLRLERPLAIGFLRMIVQLTLVGLVLRWVFAEGRAWVMAAVILVMLGFAVFEASRRPRFRFAGWLTEGLSAGAIGVAAAVATAVALASIANASSLETALSPRTLLPVLGMVLGNTLTGVSLALTTLLDLARRERTSIEAQLSLGATRWIAFGPVLRQTLRTAMLPALNGMSVAGVVSLPGMMTGQILAGADPLEAAKYQILILSVITGASALGAGLAAFGGLALLTDKRHRLRLDRLTAASSSDATA
jgi:putative ABC transport system permease protein